jgi:membrane-bound serine protease (ClpP class)
LNDNTLLLWGFGLMSAAFALVVIELFVPSGGIIAVTAFVVAVGGIVAFFRHDTWWGVSSLAFTLVMIPVIFHYAFKIIPHTPMGRRLILGQKDDEEVQRQAVAEQQARDEEQALVGLSGVALTDLRPVGAAQIEGNRIEVLAEGGAIAAGTPIRVTSVQGNQVKVRAKA